MNIRKNHFKKTLAVFISVIMVFQLMSATVFADEKSAKIQIVHTNDIHGYYAASPKGMIGYAVLKDFVDKKGADLVLDVGDAFHGQSFATVEKGESIAELMNVVGYDAMTPGNHDLSYGADRLKELEKIGGFKILASNIITEDGNDFLETPYLIKDVVADDGTKLKVGVTGVIDDKFYTSTVSNNVNGLKFTEEAKEATDTAEFLKNNEKCDIVIAITHQHDCKGFVENTKYIDAVLAGHDHLVLNERYTNSEGISVPIAEAGYYFNNIGFMEITVDPYNKKIENISDTAYNMQTLTDFEENEAVNQKAEEIKERQSEVLGEFIGYISKDYPYSWEDVRVSEQPIGKFVTESYIARTGADIAFENAGGIRAGLKAGEATYSDIISISPYGNVLVTKKVTGKDIIDILNKSVAIGIVCDDVYALQKEAVESGEDPKKYLWPENNGSYLQFSGIEFELGADNQIKSATIGGEPLDENKVYTVATNNYIADNAEYESLYKALVDKEYGTCEEALRSYIENRTDKTDEDFATRGEVVKMLLSAADDYNSGVQKRDVIKGYEDGLLHEERFVSRAEALIMLKRAFGELPKPVGHNKRVAYTSEDFTDIPDWAKPELQNVFDSGIVAGTAKGIFSPDDNVTIEQMKLFISRVFTLFGTNKNDDFYSTIHKEYLDNKELKPGRNRAGTLYDILDRVLVQTQEIISDIVSKKHEKGTAEQKMADFYGTAMNIEGRNNAGYEPIKPYLEMIDKAQSIEDLIKMQAEYQRDTCHFTFMSFLLTEDMEDSTKHVLYFTTASPEMNKNFYTDADSTKKQIYLDYVKDKLALVGDKSGIDVEQIYEFDKKIASKQLAPEDSHDTDKINNIFTFEQISEMFPNVDMETVFNAVGYKKTDRILIIDVEATKEYASLFVNENLETIKARAKIEIVNDFGSFLSKNFIDLNNEFNSKYFGINGSYTDEEIATSALQNVMNNYLGKIYAEKYFSPEKKAEVTKMVNDIIAVYKERIQNLDWMSNATKEKAIKKLNTMGVKVGYPDDWSSPLDNVEIVSKEDGGSYFSNEIAIEKARAAQRIDEQEKCVDKTQWLADVYEVNAFYNPISNDITFPAAFLQKPLYDIDKSYEYNLGSIGVAIAHEITHAFDNNGAKHDENGNIADWWTTEDYSAFQALCEKIAKYYDGYEYAPGIRNNGWLTLSENVADQGAVSCVLEIANKLENANYAELFTSIGNTLLVTTTRDFCEYLSKNDVHSIGRARLNPLVANFEEFCKAFNIDENDGMYIAPEKRVKIW